MSRQQLWFRSLSAFLVSLGLLVLLSTGQDAQTHRPLDPKGGRVAHVPDGMNCRLRALGQPIAAMPGQLEIPCDSTSVVECDGPETEPIDVEPRRLCEGRLLTRLQAIAVVVHPAAVEAWRSVRVQWLDIANGLETVTAERTMGLASDLVLQVIESDSRFLRFYRRGAAPITVSALDLARQSPWVLPRATLGGELLLPPISTTGAVALNVTGGRSVRVPLQAHPSGLSGLPAGDYEVAVVYSGGILGDSWSVPVKDGSTTVVNVPPTTVGGVAVRLPEGPCPSGARLILFPASPEGTAYRPEAQGGCQWNLQGISPGEYSASIQSSNGSLGRAPVTVVAGKNATVTTLVPSVAVDGTVVVNGQGASRARVYMRQRDDTVHYETATDSLGQYTLWVDAPGTYLLRILPDVRGPSVSRTVALRPGTNIVTSDIATGSISVQITGDPDSQRTIVVAESDLFSARTLAEQNRQTLEGLPLGTYRVSASGERATTVVSIRSASVTLTASAPTAAATLTMGSNNGRILVHDDSGRPIEGAFVRRRSRQSPTPLHSPAPGVFALDGIPEGTELLVGAAGHWAPTCIRAPSNGETAVVLGLGSPRRIVFKGPPVTELPETIGYMAATSPEACSVPLTAFRVTPAVDARGSAFDFSNFPNVAYFDWSVPHVQLRRRLDFDATGVVIVDPLARE